MNDERLVREGSTVEELCAWVKVEVESDEERI